MRRTFSPVAINVPPVSNSEQQSNELAGLRIGIGPIRLLYYTLQGLFHPARKVRDVYWKVYNTLYISAQDSLVAAYPDIKENDAKNSFTRYELTYII